MKIHQNSNFWVDLMTSHEKRYFYLQTRQVTVWYPNCDRQQTHTTEAHTAKAIICVWDAAEVSSFFLVDFVVVLLSFFFRSATKKENERRKGKGPQHTGGAKRQGNGERRRAANINNKTTQHSSTAALQQYRTLLQYDIIFYTSYGAILLYGTRRIRGLP